MTFSFIIPAYNIEAFLPQCLDSVIPVLQDSDEILISIGTSDDKTDEIACRYSSDYANVSVVKQRGKGLSDARNSAMQHAKGDYILFLDGDDYVYTNTLETLLFKLRSGEVSADLVMTDYYTNRSSDGSRVLVDQIGSRNLKGIEHLPEIICKTSAYWPVWRYIYRTSFLRDNELTFCDTVFNEDADYIAKVLLKEPDIAFVDSPFYHYRQGREGSLMNEKTFLRMEQNEGIFRRSIQLLNDENCKWKQAAVVGLQYGYVMNMANLQSLPSYEREKGYAVFRYWRQALCPTNDVWIRVFVFLFRLIGLKCTAFVLYLLKRGKRTLLGR